MPARPPMPTLERPAVVADTRRHRTGEGVDGTRSLDAGVGQQAPGWSPAAGGLRTRAAWSRDPFPRPVSPRARAAVRAAVREIRVV